ncbi:MAG TPA: hypothetical protein VMB50_06585 [Myxococcales bacterium]|nr:hypothetical protein [Myxococcales bacterium]
MQRLALLGAAAVTLSLGACAPAVLGTPSDPVLRQRAELMDSFETWFRGFRERLRDRAPTTERDCAAEAAFVLRNGQLWSARDMAPSVVDRDRLVQVARWEALRAAAGLPRDLRALTTLAELDEIAGDRGGGAWARCRTAAVSPASFDAQAGCARALDAAGELAASGSAWKRAFALAGAETQRFLVLRELEREGQTLAPGTVPADLLARYRALQDWDQLSTAQRIERLRATDQTKLHEGPDESPGIPPTRLGPSLGPSEDEP